MKAPTSDGVAVRPPILLIFAITVTGILNNSLIGPALPDIIDEFGLTSSSAGLLVGAGSLPGIVLAPVMGLLADRYGRRAVLIPCLVDFGVFGVLGALAPSFPTLLVTRMLQGFGTAGLINLAVVLIGDHFTGAERTRYLGQNAAVLTLGLAVSPLIGGVLADYAGWRLSFVVYSVALVTAVAVSRVLPRDRPATDVPIRAQLGGAFTAARRPVVAAALASATVVFICIFGLLLTVFPVHLADEFGLRARDRGLMLAVPALSASVIAFNQGRIRARWRVRTVLVGAAAAFVIAFIAVGLTGTLPLVVVGMIIYGIGEGLFLPSLQDVVNEEAPPDQRGAVIAVWVGFARLGQTLGPLLAAGGLALTTSGGVFLAGGGLAALLGLGMLLGPIGRRAGGSVPSR